MLSLSTLRASVVTLPIAPLPIAPESRADASWCLGDSEAVAFMVISSNLEGDPPIIRSH